MMENFFNEELSDREMINEWFNSLAVTTDESEKYSLFRRIQEYLLHKAPELLPEFLQNFLDLATSKNVDVKKGLVGCLEEICKMNETYLTKIMLHLHILLCDESIVVQKRVIQGTITIYKRMLTWICKVPNITQEIELAWSQLTSIKMEIVNMIDSDNDGIRTSAVKFLENVILLQSYPDPNDNKSTEFTLEEVPLTLKIVRRRKLEEEANNIFSILLKFTGSQHISSANLFACIGALANIGKNRPDYTNYVIQAVESLQSNLPPTLSTTQVSSIRKKLKSELSGLIKHPSTYECTEKLSSLLSELGLSQQEITKLLPKAEERRKYMKRSLMHDIQQPNIKRQRIEVDIDRDIYEKQRQAIDVNETFILENLNKAVCVQLVMNHFQKVPESIPVKFVNDYKESLKLGQAGDLKIISKYLAEQFVEAGVGPGNKIIGKTSLIKEPSKDDKIDTRNQDNDNGEKEKRKERVKIPKIKTLKLAEITRPLDKSQNEMLLLGAVKRLLAANKKDSVQIKQKIVTTVAANFNTSVRDSVLEFLIYDLKNNLDLALSWLYEEYSIMQGFSRVPELRREGRLDKNYNILLNSFVEASKEDPLMLIRIVLESPMITEEVLGKLCEICRNESSSNWSIGLLKDLILKRPTKQSMFLKALLSLTTHESIVVRDCAVTHIIDLYKRNELMKEINEFIVKYLDYLKSPQPPNELFGNSQGRITKMENWNENLVKACIQAYIMLLPINEALIHELAKVYVGSSADVKRIILRLLETPIRTMGMESQELLKLVEECPKGSETLITRLIHILTDKGLPTPQLVQRVRDLYNTRISDVRFLIPVLNGLTKKEVITALPKLIKLNPIVVKEVFNRLLGIHGESSVTPTELLVALHLIDSNKADIKTVMKATSMCLNEKHIFTQEVLAVVLQQLMDQPHLPTLLMRTVIQALSSYPRLSGFVMNILQRLILKQVWKNKIVWEGFVKCCQRTQPQSFAVLMQLPSAQLIEALEMSPDLKEPLKEHLLNLTENQRAHVPSTVQEVLLGPTPKVPIVEPPLIKHSESILSEPLPPGMD